MKQIILLSVILFSGLVQHLHANDLEDVQIYYDENNHPLPPMPPRADNRPSVRIPTLSFGPLPCSCQNISCCCCANIYIKVANFARKVCFKVTYNPPKLGVNLDVTFNETHVFKYGFSALLPPTRCMPIVIPYLMTPVSFCLGLSISPTDSKNLQMCGNLVTNVMAYSVYDLQISCLKLGMDGISISRYNKPIIEKTINIQNSDKNTNIPNKNQQSISIEDDEFFSMSIEKND